VSSRWKFGVGETRVDELREIAVAQRRRVIDDYMNGQRGARMIEAETDPQAGTPRSGLAINDPLDEEQAA